MYAIFKEFFDAKGCLAYIICGGSIGIVIGYIIKTVRGQDEGDAFANATGATMYNMYVGVHNLRVYSLLLIPVSIVYLVIMSVIEAITHEIPETFEYILNKLVIFVSGIESIALVIFLITQIR